MRTIEQTLDYIEENIIRLNSKIDVYSGKCSYDYETLSYFRGALNTLLILKQFIMEEEKL